VLARADDPGSGMFVIEEGRVVVEARGQRLELGPGEFVGELALLVPDSTRVARVRAQTPVVCLAIGRSEFAELLEAEPRIGPPVDRPDAGGLVAGTVACMGRPGRS
jgi:CRP-like cAMP-binding protein